jgi:pyruvate,water dikinase
VPDGFVVIAGAETLSELKPTILEAFDALKTSFAAVRSSAVNEDGDTAAWAGQLDTFLNVPRDQLLRRIADCMASADSARARAYALHRKLTAGNVAVIVQAMVDSDVSGVAFSAHPVTGSRDHIVIEAALGLGEAVVSGEITPDTYTLEAVSGKVTKALIARQTRQLVRGKHDTTTWQTLQPPADDPKLTSPQLTELVGTVCQLANFYGYPIDVEWAFADGALYILQVRPITTL